MLYDSQGKAFGRMLNESVVVTTVSGSAMAVQLVRGESQDFNFTATDFEYGTLYFTGPNCTGEMFLYETYTPQINGMGRGAVVVDASSWRRYLYPSVGGRVPTVVDIQSEFNGACQPFVYPGMYPLIRAGTPVDLGGFTPPFTIR